MVISFLRAGKVSIELSVQTCLQTGDEMRTRLRLSGYAAKVHNVRWTLVVDGPKQSVDGAGSKCRLHARYN